MSYQIFVSKNKFLGIDLGTLNIKIIEVTKKEKKIEVTNFGIIPILNFDEVGISSYILEENISFILNEFFETTKIKTRQAFFNIPIPHVFSTNFLVPYIPENSLFNVVRFEAQRQLPLSLEEVEFEYRYFSFESQDLKNWLIFLSAVSKNYIKKIQNITELSKIKLSGYGIEYFNFEPYFLGKSGNFLIVDLGHSYSTLTLIKDHKVIYGSKIKTQGLIYLKSIANITQYPEEKTLDLIYEKGFLFLPEERELKSLAENFLDEIASIINTEVLKLENTFFLRIDKIFWTGGLSILPGFLEKMLAKLPRFQQEILKPQDIVQGEKFSNLKEKATIFSPVLGLVLRKLMS